MAEYRSNYEKSRLIKEYNELERELNSIKNMEPTYQPSFRMPQSNNNFFELDRWFMEKILLIGGCIAIGALITYLYLNKK